MTIKSILRNLALLIALIAGFLIISLIIGLARMGFMALGML